MTAYALCVNLNSKHKQVPAHAIATDKLANLVGTHPPLPLPQQARRSCVLHSLENAMLKS